MQAVVLQIDADDRRLSLGVKQLQPDAWETFFRGHVTGDIVKGREPGRRIRRLCGTSPGVEGLCHNSEIPAEMRANNPPLPIGEELSFKIIKLNEMEKRIGLAIASASAEQERQRLDEYQRQAEQAGQGIGEATHPDDTPESE